MVVDTEHPQDNEMAERCCMLDKRLKAIKGRDAFDLDALNTCLVPGLITPAKFKVPEFDKYKGDSYPKHHLVMFCRKMT